MSARIDDTKIPDTEAARAAVGWSHKPAQPGPERIVETWAFPVIRDTRCVTGWTTRGRMVTVPMAFVEVSL